MAEPVENTSEKTGKQPRYSVQPEFWENVMDALPPWIDEISAIVLLVFGAISSLALLDVSPDAALSKAWSDTLTSLFGQGAVLISAGIFMLGVIILLPKIGLTVRFSTRRILALEVAFLSTLAILHLAQGDNELRALARAGEGGGTIGWGISVLPYLLFGASVTMILFGILLAISLGIVMGVRRAQINEWLERNSTRLRSYGEALLKEAAPPAAPTPAAPAERPAYSLDLSLQRHPPLMRIKADLSQLPPSLRNPAPEPELPKDEVSERLQRALVHEEKEEREDYGIIGKLVDKKLKTDAQMVERPDGRIKRYFTVESMSEAKKVIKRDKNLPDLSLLQDSEMVPPDEYEINHNVVLIENTLLEFDINVDVVDVKIGPTVTQYAVQPFREVKQEEEIIKERTRLSKIASLSSDLALALSAKRLRLETPVPGHSYMGVEVPNKNPSVVSLRSVYESKAYFDATQKNPSPLLVPLGRDVAGAPVMIDIAKMPHLLIAGTTGSGKSVCIAAVAAALLLNNAPDQVQFVMLDPKMVELSRFNNIPHLIGPVETDIERIIEVLRWCTREMDRRYKLLEENAARNIDTYNSRLGQRRKSEQLPYIVILIDEIGDLMMSKPEETEKAITRLAQMARAVGMHLIVATQRPSVDVITGLIKANFPGRISFAVASGVDSRVILDTVGAENLLGNGDMLYLAQDAAGPRRVQGCYVSDSEVRAIVRHWRLWRHEREKAGERYGIAPWERGLTRRELLAETDPMLEDAIELVVEEQEASASMIQRKLGLGYPRAARIVDLLEELGIVGESTDGGRTRKVLIEKGKDPFKEIVERRTRNK
ncbi:MAG: DNA translocase FtsK [Anaerolineae bacterium]